MLSWIFFPLFCCVLVFIIRVQFLYDWSPLSTRLWSLMVKEPRRMHPRELMLNKPGRLHPWDLMLKKPRWMHTRWKRKSSRTTKGTRFKQPSKRLGEERIVKRVPTPKKA
ncbi:hypothetical protein V8G54_015298 [Vigna mungo]|uniref:Uncharacterized protein n=1 Tax=Vigna mungo TaxID=3915 RepID=A0AAQ3NKV9_VIGMU